MIKASELLLGFKKKFDGPEKCKEVQVIYFKRGMDQLYRALEGVVSKCRKSKSRYTNITKESKKEIRGKFSSLINPSRERMKINEYERKNR